MTEDDHEIKSHDHPSKHGAEGSDIVGRHYASRRRIDKVDYKSSHLWLVSFTDVMALMLTFLFCCLPCPSRKARRGLI